MNGVIHIYSCYFSTGQLKNNGRIYMYVIHLSDELPINNIITSCVRLQREVNIFEILSGQKSRKNHVFKYRQTNIRGSKTN